MIRSGITRTCITALALVVMAACSDSGSSTSPSTSVDLSGKWTGTVGSSTSDLNPATTTWTATQSGSTMTGPFSVSFKDGSTVATFTGTLSGTVSGSSVALTASFPAGSFVAAGGPSTCSMNGTSNATLSGNNKITGTLSIAWAASCIGTVADNATETNVLTLNKQ